MGSFGFGKKRIPGSGPVGSKILILGESPGVEEERDGEPFIGTSGHHLDTMLAAAGIERRDCRVDNICQYRPFGDKELAFFQGKRPRKEYLEGIARIRLHLQKHKPNVVIALGKYALWGLTLESKIGNLRGSIMESRLVPGQKLIPTYHPAWMLRGNWHWRQVLIWDFQKAKAESEFPELNLPEYDVTVAETPAQLAEAADEILAAEKFSFDIETFGGKNLACCGFGLSDRRAIVIPHTGAGTAHIFQYLLENDIPKIAQNAMFEYTFFGVVFGIRPQNIVWDTMLAQHACFPTLPKALDFLTSVHTRQPFYKEERHQWSQQGDLNILWQYNAKDCCNTYEIADKQQKVVDGIDIETRYGERTISVRNTAEFMMSLIEPYGEATIKGVKGDREWLEFFDRRTERNITRLQKALDKKFGRSVNYRSPKQVAALIYDELKLPERKRGGGRTTKQEVLVDLAAKTGSKELQSIVNYRRLAKAASNYNVTKLDDDDRFRCSYNIAGTKNGRLSSSETLWDSGMNLQNQPEYFRRGFIPDEKKIFGVWDLAQAEAIIVTFEAQDPLEMEWFEKGLDLHRMLAAYILQIDPEDVTDESRYLFKRSHHALNYRMGHLKFSFVVNGDFDKTGIGITAAEAKWYKENYMLARPFLETWWKEIIAEVRDNGFLTNLVGRHRIFIEQYSDELFNDAIAFKPQSTIGDLTHMAVRAYYEDEELQELRRAGKMDYLLQTHDGNVFQIDKDIFDHVAEKLTQHSLIPLESKGRKYRIPVEVKAGKKSWSKKDLSDIGKWR